MGYAKPDQDAGGLHLRQYSRTVIIEDFHGTRIVYTSIDAGMISQLLRLRVLDKLKQIYGEQLYNETNVMMSAQHTHSCPGGFFQYMLYNIPSAGFISQTLEALIEGIVKSIAIAHDSVRPGKIYYNEGKLFDASINRSPTAYENNPLEERVNYKNNVDTTMHLLKLVNLKGEPIGIVNWFPVHGTSMNNTNRLISSDNKGYASLLMEQEYNPVGTLPGKGKFVAIFAQANEGDVSPNTRGPRCIDTGLPCDSITSTCGNPPRNEKCIAQGPGKDMFESTKIIAYKQYYKARELMMDDGSQKLVRGPVRFVHEHIDMTNQIVPLYKSVVDLAAKQQPNPEIPVNASYRTCPASLGYSFGAGTTDGPGAFDFQQADTASSRYWNMLRDFVRKPSEEQMKCHHPKPILLSTGEMDFPYMWHPRIVPTQVLMIGQVAIVGLPGEFTTMAGRRVRNVVAHTLKHGPTQILESAAESEDDDEEAEPVPANGGGGGGSGENERDEMQNDEQQQTAPSITTSKQQNNNQQQQQFLVPKRSNRNRRSQKQEQQQQQRPVKDNDFKVILSGLSNIYNSYVTTFEEYAIQRYEGASTLYGPHTLQAYVNQFRRLVLKMINNEKQVLGPEPPDLTKSLFTLKPGVIYDGSPSGKTFGSVLGDVNTTRPYKCGEIVKVSFVSGHPRNDLRLGDSFLYVDRYTPATSLTMLPPPPTSSSSLLKQTTTATTTSTNNGSSAAPAPTKWWTIVATDSSWETKYIWERTNTWLGESRATIEWELPADCRTGIYRIRHYGAHKSLLQTISQYSGQSSLFKVISEPSSASQLAQLEAQLKTVSELETAAEQQQKQFAAMAAQQAAASNRDDILFSPASNTSSLSYYSPLNLLSNLFNWRAPH